VLDMTKKIEKLQRRPACGQCGGTGYVYLWAVARAGPRTWFCDRCKLFWSDGEPILTTLIGDQVGVPAALPVLAGSDQQPLQPVMDGRGAAEPSQPKPRLVRVIEPNGIKAAAPAPHAKLPL
jgi:ribosomal protein L37AE/L43A